MPMQYSRTPLIARDDCGYTHKRFDPGQQRRLMVSEQLMGRGISDVAVLKAMAEVPRHLFVDEALRDRAYEECSLPIGYGQTISQPFTVALMSQLLLLEKGMRILEIGTGSGYQAAILSAMGCRVYSIERRLELYLKTRELLQRLRIPRVSLFHRDGTLGMPDAPPFDRIIVTAGGPEIPPPLIDQLEDGGILLLPIGTRQGDQRLVRLHKNNGEQQVEDFGPVAFVDLIGNHGW